MIAVPNPLFLPRWCPALSMFFAAGLGLRSFAWLALGRVCPALRVA
ncbi:MAG: hypothetical protein KA214_05970 [Neisseriaceae bacterium]|nr:hypothetical protein [Neisseriaceae bacterium]